MIQGAGFAAGSGQGMGGRRRCDGNGEEKEVEGGGRRMTGGAQLSVEKIEVQFTQTAGGEVHI